MFRCTAYVDLLTILLLLNDDGPTVPDPEVITTTAKRSALEPETTPFVELTAEQQQFVEWEEGPLCGYRTDAPPATNFLITGGPW